MIKLFVQGTLHKMTPSQFLGQNSQGIDYLCQFTYKLFLCSRYEASLNMLTMNIKIVKINSLKAIKAGCEHNFFLSAFMSDQVFPQHVFTGFVLWHGLRVLACSYLCFKEFQRA